LPYRRIALGATLWLVPTLGFAQQPTPPQAGGPPHASGIGADAGPANQPPRSDSPQAVNRGTDGSAVGLTEPASTGTTPQGFLGQSTAGSRDPNRPTGGAPPQSQPTR
jgi:hypothetical protein